MQRIESFRLNAEGEIAPFLVKLEKFGSLETIEGTKELLKVPLKKMKVMLHQEK